MGETMGRVALPTDILGKIFAQGCPVLAHGQGFFCRTQGMEKIPRHERLVATHRTNVLECTIAVPGQLAIRTG